MEADAALENTSSLGGKARGALRQTADRYRALGAYPDARRLLVAATISYIGGEFNFLALIALSYQLTDSVLGVGGMLVAFSVPQLLLQGPAGALVDRNPGPRLLMLTQLLLACIAAGYLLMLVAPSLWLLYGLVISASIVRTVDTPAFEVRLMSLVPPAQRGAANALHMLAMSVSGLIGPVLGGVVLAAVGAAPLFVLNSLSFLGVIAVLATIRPKLASPEVTGAGEAAEDGRSRIGYASLLRRPDVALYSGVCITSGLINVALVAVLLVRAQDLGLGEGGLGLFLAAASLGALVGGIIAGGIGYEGSRAFAIAALTGALGTIGIVMFGLTNSALAALVVLVLAGIVGAIGEIAGTTAFQNVLPEGVFGRAFSLFLMAGAAGGLIGGIAGPLLSETIGVGASLTLLAIPDLILLVLFGWWAGNLRGRFTLPSLAGPVLEPEVAGHVVVRRPQRAITPIPPRGILSPLLPAPTRFD